MKTLEVVQAVETVDNSAKVKETIVQNWESFYTKEDLIDDIEQGYIFGKYASNEHYQRQWIASLVDEVEVELAPDYVAPVEEPIPPTDSEILDKLLLNDIITQAEIDVATAEVVVDKEPVAEEPVIVEEVSVEEPIVEELPIEGKI